MGSAGHGLNYMADLISTNSSSSRNSSEAVEKGSTSFSPAVIVIVGVLGTAFLLVSYYTMVAKYCRGRRAVFRGWARRRWNEEGQGLQATWTVAAQSQEQGLEEAEIEAIPVVEVLRRERHAECAVCLSEFQEAERARLLPSCCHAFHLPCIDAWLRSHASCPLCRTPILLHHHPSAPTSPLCDESSHTSSPLDTAASAASGHPMSGHNTPSSMQKLQPLEPEQFLRKGNLAMTLPIKQLDIMLANEGEDFSFGRCFSTGRSRGFLNRASLHSQDAAQQHSSKHTHIGMQRSCSYHVGSIFPILKRHSPNDLISSSSSRVVDVASPSPAPPFTSSYSPSSSPAISINCGQASRDCNPGQ